MSTRSVTAVAVAIALGAAPATMAKDRGRSAARNGGPPTIDIQRTCREDTGALRAVQGGGQDMGVCLSDEREARQQLVKEWASYPAVTKSQCVQTAEYLPGYVEWLSCIQMMRDVLQLRKQQGPSTAVSGAGSRSRLRRAGLRASRVCPAVKYTENGSIDYVINC